MVTLDYLLPQPAAPPCLTLLTPLPNPSPALCPQIDARLTNLVAEQRGIQTSVDELARRRAEASRQAEEQQVRVVHKFDQV